MKHHKQHRPGSLMDRRPVSAETLARLDQLAWEQSPEKFAQRTWAQIKRWAEDEQ